GGSAILPAEDHPSHYYAARATDSALVRVCGERPEEFEKFLFYRGVGDFEVPLNLTLGAGGVTIKNPDTRAGVNCLVFENRDGRLGFTRVQLPAGGAVTVPRPSLLNNGAAVENELVAMLTGEGLFEKEAQAMVATWRDSWFEDGLRVFYIVPR